MEPLIDNGVRTCLRCRREFVLPIKRRTPERGKYCSRQCKLGSHAGATNPNFRAAGKKVCAGCQVPFKHYSKSRRFCSLACYQATPEAAQHRRSVARAGYRGGRKDLNQNAIVEALEAVGASVYDASLMGHGFPDLIVGFRGQNVLMEIKNPNSYYGRSGMNDLQMAWAASWRGAEPLIIRSIDEALAVIGVQR